jgi:uncharacterized SAM-binding protein YcdF (DUF218 family)
MLRLLLEYLVLPPASALLLILFGTLLRRMWSGVGRALQVVGVLWLWLASTPAFAGYVLGSLQSERELPPTGQLPAADAIVVLGAEADTDGREYPGAVIGQVTMQRVRYAAALAKRTQLPVLVSGGKPASDVEPLANLMAAALEQEFGVKVQWREDRSADTWENAAFATELLRKDEKQTILLVTSAWHERRAMASFQRQPNALRVIAAPTAFRDVPFQGPQSLLPQWSALRDTSWALHEICGLAYYSIRHGS